MAARCVVPATVQILFSKQLFSFRCTMCHDVRYTFKTSEFQTNSSVQFNTAEVSSEALSKAQSVPCLINVRPAAAVGHGKRNPSSTMQKKLPLDSEQFSRNGPRLIQ